MDKKKRNCIGPKALLKETSPAAFTAFRRRYSEQEKEKVHWTEGSPKRREPKTPTKTLGLPYPHFAEEDRVKKGNGNSTRPKASQKTSTCHPAKTEKTQGLPHEQPSAEDMVEKGKRNCILPKTLVKDINLRLLQKRKRTGIDHQSCKNKLQTSAATSAAHRRENIVTN